MMEVNQQPPPSSCHHYFLQSGYLHGVMAICNCHKPWMYSIFLLQKQGSYCIG